MMMSFIRFVSYRRREIIRHAFPVLEDKNNSDQQLISEEVGFIHRHASRTGTGAERRGTC